jgi:hypothetical protein
MNKIFSILLATLFLAGCSGTSKKGAQGDTQVQTTISEKPAEKSEEKTLLSAGDLMVEIVDRKEQYLLGREVNLPYEKLMQDMPSIMREAMDVAAGKKVMLTGSPSIALLEKPEKGKNIRMYIGLLVNKPTKGNGIGTLTIPSGTYYKAFCNTEAGTGMSYHRKIEEHIKKNGKKSGYPILESYGASRNEEMTTTLTKCTMLYPAR